MAVSRSQLALRVPLCSPCRSGPSAVSRNLRTRCPTWQESIRPPWRPATDRGAEERPAAAVDVSSSYTDAEEGGDHLTHIAAPNSPPPQSAHVQPAHILHIPRTHPQGPHLSYFRFLGITRLRSSTVGRYLDGQGVPKVPITVGYKNIDSNLVIWQCTGNPCLDAIPQLVWDSAVQSTGGLGVRHQNGDLQEMREPRVARKLQAVRLYPGR